MTTEAEPRVFRTPVPPPSIRGLRIRHFAGPGDYAGMNDAANASRLADGDDFITPLEGFASFYDHLVNCDRDRDLLIVVVDGRIVGYGRTSWALEDRGEAEAEGEAGAVRVHQTICFLRPDWRRKGIGRTMLAALIGRIEELRAELPPVTRIEAEAIGDVAVGGLEPLLQLFGFEPIRFGYQMLRPTLEDQPDAPLPAGLEIREVRDEHLRAIWDAADEAFRDGNGYRPSTEDDFQVFIADPLQADRTLWRVAWDGDEVAGQVRGYINAEANAAMGTNRGWVENISVRRPYRHRGLARALINETFKVLRARGATEGVLGVDATNPTGALRVYESMGFAPIRESRTYRKPIG
jgi:ribosomal protein S18 acetylase RimI-like enzyme